MCTSVYVCGCVSYLHRPERGAAASLHRGTGASEPTTDGNNERGSTDRHNPVTASTQAGAPLGSGVGGGSGERGRPCEEPCERAQSRRDTYVTGCSG